MEQKFKDYRYEPVDTAKVKADLEALIKRFTEAQSAREQIAIFEKIAKYRDHIETMFQLCNVRFTLDTNDKYYAQEQDANDLKMPEYAAIVNAYFIEVNRAKYKKELIKKYGSLYFKQIELNLRCFDPKIVPDLQEENKWSSAYAKLIGSAKIKYAGKVYNLPTMRKFLDAEKRRTRSSAFKAISQWFELHCAEFDEIYDNLVRIRDRIAKTLGYDNYVQLGYYRLGRTDYGPDEVAKYRRQIYRSVVPIAQKLYREQARRLHIRGMKSYDYNLQFLSGNATPRGSTAYKVSEATKMYEEMSPETGEFFKRMVAGELIDLDARPGKTAGGYTCTFSEYKVPFVFANFNNTSGDIDVLTHEMGHAFMAYTVYKNNPDVLSESVWPTYEACEIHSMSMELFAYPYLERFFKEDAEKYKYAHLVDAVEFLPYGAAIDEFQHFVYENPTVSPEERRTKWRKIEKKYQPHLKYSTEFFEKGAKWFQQMHVFQSPFYYIDYTLAQVCAFQFFNLMNVDREKAWNTYLYLCRLGGSKSFLDLLKAIDFANPFKAGTIAKIMEPIREYLNTFDVERM